MIGFEGFEERDPVSGKEMRRHCWKDLIEFGEKGFICLGFSEFQMGLQTPAVTIAPLSEQWHFSDYPTQKMTSSLRVSEMFKSLSTKPGPLRHLTR